MLEESQLGVGATFGLAASKHRRAQLDQGAQTGAFVSAGQTEMEELVTPGLVGTAGRVALANSGLAVVLADETVARSASPQEWARPGVHLAIVAQLVAAGRYAQRAIPEWDGSAASLGVFGYAQDLLASVVSSNKSVHQTFSPVQPGEAHTASVCVSDAIPAPGLSVLELTAEEGILAGKAVAALASSHRCVLARRSVEILLTPEGQGILEHRGFAGEP